jgi:RHS repeat-associated protein
LRTKYVNYQPKASSKHACRQLRRHVNHRTTRYQPTTLTWTASYDSRDRLTALVRSNTSSRYQYDANSNRLSSVAQTIADTNGNATFEALDTAANTAQALAVDATSNRLLGFTQSITSVRGSQTLSTVNSAVNYSLDAAGNLSSDGLRAFAYDATNRHTSTRSPAGADTATVQYLFNALGQRVFKSVVSLSSGTGVVSGGANTATGSITPMPTLGQFYSYADDSEGTGSGGSSASLPSYAMLGEYCNGASGCVQQEYLWLPLDNGQAIPVGLLRSSRLYAIHTDHLGTPRLIHDDSNTPIWQWAYSAFGENAPSGPLKATTNVNAVFALGANNAKLTVSAPGITVNLRFAGQYADSESNLFYNTYRSYAPALGRYSQSDPIGLEGGWSRFGYANANPLKFTDALGLMGGGSAVNKGKGPPTIGVFGCVGIACVGSTTQDSEAQVSLEATLGGGIEICDPPKPTPAPLACTKRCNSGGIYDRKCDDQAQPPGIPMPRRWGGLFLGPSFKADGRFCLRIGVFGAPPIPLPSIDLGGLSE